MPKIMTQLNIVLVNVLYLGRLHKLCENCLSNRDIYSEFMNLTAAYCV